MVGSGRTNSGQSTSQWSTKEERRTKKLKEKRNRTRDQNQETATRASKEERTREGTEQMMSGVRKKKTTENQGLLELVGPPGQTDMRKTGDLGIVQDLAQEIGGREATAEIGVIETEVTAETGPEEEGQEEGKMTTMGGGLEGLAGRPNV